MEKMYKAEFHRDASLGSLECRKQKFTRFSWWDFPLQRLIQDGQRQPFLKFENVITFDSEALDPHVIPQF